MLNNKLLATISRPSWSLIRRAPFGVVNDIHSLRLLNASKNLASSINLNAARQRNFSSQGIQPFKYSFKTFDQESYSEKMELNEKQIHETQNETTTTRRKMREGLKEVAYEFIEKNLWQNAVQKYQEIIESFESDYDNTPQKCIDIEDLSLYYIAKYNQSSCFFQMQRFEEAIQGFKALLEACDQEVGKRSPFLSENKGLFLRFLGDCYRFSTNYQEAINCYTEALKLENPNNDDDGDDTIDQAKLSSSVHVHEARHLMYMKLGNFSSAIEDLDYVLDNSDVVKPLSPIYKLLLSRGAMKELAGDIDGCIEDHVDVCNMIMNFEEQTKECPPEEKIEIELEMGNIGEQEKTEIFLSTAILLFNQKKFDLCIKCSSYVLEKSPDHVEARRIRARSYFMLKEIKYAVEDRTYIIVNKLDNNYLDYYERGTSFQLIEQYQEALDDFTKAIELSPNHDFLYYHRAYCYSKLGMTELHDQDVAKAKTLSPQENLNPDQNLTS